MNLSSSSSSSLDLSPKNAAAGGCAASILRRLLCASLPHTTPTDGVQAETATLRAGTASEQQSSPAPNIVARLMGLESMPVSPCAPSPGFIGRSRSTNSLDSWPGFLSDRRKIGGAVSRSFREVPTHLRAENDEFLILSFSPDDRKETFRSNGTKPKMGCRQLREVKVDGSSKAKKEIRTERRIATVKRNHSDVDDLVPPPKKDFYRKLRRGVKADNSGKLANHGEMAERSINTRKKLAFVNRRIELECSSQNSSPVSVLDHSFDTDGEYLNSPDSPISHDWKPKRKNSRTKLSPDLSDRNDQSPLIQLTKICRDGGMRSIDEQNNKSRKHKQARHDFSEMWGFIIRLAEDDAMISNWVSREIEKSEDAEELAASIGIEILDFLLYEFVTEHSDLAIKT